MLKHETVANLVVTEMIDRDINFAQAMHVVNVLFLDNTYKYEDREKVKKIVFKKLGF